MGRQTLYRSRLLKRTEKRGKKTLFFSVIGIVIVTFLIFKFGIPLLIRFSVLVGDVTQTNEAIEEKKTAFILTPKLSPLPTATNSATIALEGITMQEGDIEIFLNDELVTKTKGEDGKFSVALIRLTEGENRIKVRSKTKEGDTSSFSEEIGIIYDKEPPLLEIGEPDNNKTVGKEEKTIVVSGITEENARVTVNGFWAVIGITGRFSYNLMLGSDKDTITIEAVDLAGNKTTVERKITISQ